MGVRARGYLPRVECASGFLAAQTAEITTTFYRNRGTMAASYMLSAPAEGVTATHLLY